MSKFRDNWPLLVPAIIVVVAIIFAIKSKISEPKPYIIGRVDTEYLSVASEIPGRVMTVLVEEGEDVKIGDTLIILHSRKVDALSGQADALLNAASANEKIVDAGARKSTLLSARNFYRTTQEQYLLAQKNYQRGESLYSDSVISKVELELLKFKYSTAKRGMESAKSDYNSLRSGSRKESKDIAKAGVNQAKSAQKMVNALAEDVIIKAHAAGIISDLVVKAGEVVNMGYPLMTIMLPDQMHATANLKQDETLPYKKGVTLKAYIPGVSKDRDDLYSFKIRKVAAMLDFADWTPTNLKGSFDMKTMEIALWPTEKIEGLIPGMTLGFIPISSK